MEEIYPNLFIGSDDDYKFLSYDLKGWYVIHACKEPYHRNALRYVGRSAPKDHPEYLIAERDGHLILNLVDAPDPSYIPKEIIDSTFCSFINQTVLFEICTDTFLNACSIL